MKNKPIFDLKKDLWVLIFDVIAVNISYFMAIILRYYIRYQFVPEATDFLKIFWRFAPIYTVISIAVFLLFRLYNGLWAYAGLAHMNRIVLASVCASVLYVIGTSVLFRPMPSSFYLVGAAIQLVLILMIRYIYKIIAIEKQRVASKNQPVQKMMLIGSEATAQKVLAYLNNEPGFVPVVVVDEKSTQKTLNGLPIMHSAFDAFEKYKTDCVMIADPLLSDIRREEIRKACKERNLELYDYSGFIKNIAGSLPFTDLMRVVSSPATIKAGDKTYGSAEEVLRNLNGRFSVASITGDKLVIEIKPAGEAVTSEDWIKEHEQESGEEVSFF